jgi:hypothetical protein
MKYNIPGPKTIESGGCAGSSSSCYAENAKQDALNQLNVNNRTISGGKGIVVSPSNPLGSESAIGQQSAGTTAKMQELLMKTQEQAKMDGCVGKDASSCMAGGRRRKKRSSKKNKSGGNITRNTMKNIKNKIKNSYKKTRKHAKNKYVKKSRNTLLYGLTPTRNLASEFKNVKSINDISLKTATPKKLHPNKFNKMTMKKLRRTTSHFRKTSQNFFRKLRNSF